MEKVNKQVVNMKSIKIFLDMDGVISDFLAYYLLLGLKINMPVKPPYTDYSKNPDLFKIAVKEHSIFEHLSNMPLAIELIDFLRELEDEFSLQIEVLTSVNSDEEDVISAAIAQKTKWLKQAGIHWKSNFVSSGEEKGGYACNSAILIDDSDHCLKPFAENNGIALKYEGFTECFKINLKNSIESIINI